MANTDKAPCECSKFEAGDIDDLTEDNLETGDYETFSTGCQAETGRTFAPGHDARLKSHLIRWGAMGLEVSRVEDGMRVGGDAQSWANKYEFGYMVANGIAKAVEKAQAKATREAARAAKKAAKATPRADDLEHDGNSARREREAKALSLAEIAKAEDEAHREAEARKVAEREASAEWTDEPTTVKAKVGRWEFEGNLVNDGALFQYTDRKGNPKSTTKFKLI